MGTLKPGATYIYERADGVVYAREAGADPSTRIVVGYESGKDYDPVRNSTRENQQWHDIRSAAETNPALQEALDRVKVIYELSKNE